MTTFNQELTGRYVSAGADRPSLDDRRVARAAFVRDTVRTIYDADKKFGIDPVDLCSLAELVDAGRRAPRAHQPRRQPAISRSAAHQQRETA